MKLEHIDNPEEIGVSYEDCFRIIKDGTAIGTVWMNTRTVDINIDNALEIPYIEWLEFELIHRGKGYLREALQEILFMYQAEWMQFECSDELLEKYQHIGAIHKEYDGIREIHTLWLKKEKMCCTKVGI